MENITDIVVGITNKRVKELAYEILGEIQDELAGHICTGAAYRSFSVAFNGRAAAINSGDFATGAEGSFHGGFLTNVTIGSNEPSAYYLDQGNGGSGAIITSTRERDSRDRIPGKLHLEHIGPGVFAAYVHGYDGIDYIKEVADRHR